ncbi:hypothetical protein QE152_g23411 [Popillia japonica]|uniref:Uncharacterized protein n=1 Tax=Popillia japonica TaxID=7064 RepID=A0AAW1KHM7_POPJA
MVFRCGTAPIQLYNILRSSLVNDAATWFSVVENTFASFEEFEVLFLSKFWSETEQDKIRSNLYMGKFNAQKGNSREQYFINRYATVRHLTPKLTEKEIIKHFARHYDFEIHKTVIVQNITTFKDFCEIDFEIHKTVIVQNITTFKDFCEILRQYDRHYDFEIHKTVIVQNITTFKDFCEILRQYDDLYKHKNTTPVEHQRDNYTPYYLRNFETVRRFI